MRYRELKLSDLDRTRDVVREWRDEHPDGTAEQLIADVGDQFHPEWGLNLRVGLYAEDRRRAGLRIVAGQPRMGGAR